MVTAEKEPENAEEQTPEAAASRQAKRLHQSRVEASMTWSRKTAKLAFRTLCGPFPTHFQLPLEARKNDCALVPADGSVKRTVPVVLVTSRNGNQLARSKDF